MEDIGAGNEGPPEYARGGLVIGPNGEDSVEVRLFEREAIVDRDGRVICRHVGGRLYPPENDEPRFDASDVIWSTGPLRLAQLIIGGFTVRIGEDGSEVVADDDAIVVDLDPAGEATARRAYPFIWSAVPVDEDEEGQP